MRRTSEDAHSATRDSSQAEPAKRKWRNTDLGEHRALIVVIAVAYWSIAAIKGTSVGYELAGVATAWLLIDASRPWIRSWMRSKGIPEWTASEAYITRWRRWWHSTRSDD